MKVSRRSPVGRAILRNRRKRWVAGRGGRSVRRKVLGSRVYHFMEPYTDFGSSLINVAPTANSGGIMKFSINQLTNFSSYQGLFDLYKINKVQLKIIPWGNSAEVNQIGVGPGQSALPLLYIAPNRDYYAPAPTSVADIVNDDGVRCIQVSRPTTLTLKYPRPAVMDASGNAIQYGILPNKVGQWLTTGGNAQSLNQSMVPYFGFRWFCENQNSSGFSPRIVVKLFFSMKERD